MQEVQNTPELEAMIAERDALEKRVYAINDKINKQEAKDDEEYNLLNLQAFAMRSYNYAISARIAKYKKEMKK